MIPAGNSYPAAGALPAASGGGGCAGKRQQKGTAPSPVWTSGIARRAMAESLSRHAPFRREPCLLLYATVWVGITVDVGHCQFLRFCKMLLHHTAIFHNSQWGIPKYPRKSCKNRPDMPWNRAICAEKRASPAAKISPEPGQLFPHRQPAACGRGCGRSAGSAGRSRAAATAEPWAG